MRQSWQTIVSLISAASQFDCAGFRETWACNLFHGPVGAYKWKPLWEVPSCAMKSMDIKYALCLFETRHKGHIPLKEYFHRVMFDLAAICLCRVSKKWYGAKQWKGEVPTEGGEIVKVFEQNHIWLIMCPSWLLILFLIQGLLTLYCYPLPSGDD